MAIVNLTPHAIVIRSDSGADITIPSSGTVARVSSKPGEDFPCTFDGVPLRTSPTYGLVEGLPPGPLDGTIYVVSAMVGGQVRRPDVFCPDTGSDAIRNDKGQIVAVRRLIGTI